MQDKYKNKNSRFRYETSKVCKIGCPKSFKCKKPMIMALLALMVASLESKGPTLWCREWEIQRISVWEILKVNSRHCLQIAFSASIWKCYLCTVNHRLPSVPADTPKETGGACTPAQNLQTCLSIMFLGAAIRFHNLLSWQSTPLPKDRTPSYP